MDQTYSVAALVSPLGSEIIFRDNNELCCAESHCNLRHEKCQEKCLHCITSCGVLKEAMSKLLNRDEAVYEDVIVNVKDVH